MLVWILGWTAGTLYFDYSAVKGLVEQHATSSFTPTTGTVEDSQLNVSSDSEGGSSYTPVIQYRYWAGGQEYHGAKWRLGMTSNMKSQSTALVNAHPAGSRITIYYDPADPSRAVLAQGLSGVDFFMFIFLVPFNAVALII